MTQQGDIAWIGLPGERPTASVHGAKAAMLASAADAGLPVPPGFVLPEGCDDRLLPSLAALSAAQGTSMDDDGAPLLLAVRASTTLNLGAGLPAVLNIGVSQAALPALERAFGPRIAQDLYRRAIHSFGTGALGIEGEEFEYALHDALRLAGVDSETELETDQLARLAETCLSLIEDEGAGTFPQTGVEQLETAVAAMRRAWSAPRAVARRTALGDAADAPMALIVQAMVLGVGQKPSGAGRAEMRDEMTGKSILTGRFLPQAQGDEALMGMRTPNVLTIDERSRRGLHEPALEEIAPQAAAQLGEARDRLERAIGDAVSVDFTLQSGRLWFVEVRRARRSARGAVEIAVSLAESGAISRRDAVRRVDAGHLEELLHPSVDPSAARNRVGQGLPASPGAAAGSLTFSPDDAEAAAARGSAAILALIETSPEDIRGMHAAQGVVTTRGGMTSHAAVVARGLGKPCVVGVKDMQLDVQQGVLVTGDGTRLHAGDMVTVDGTTGEVLSGKVAVIPPDTGGALQTLLGWTDDIRRMEVRANADTAVDAKTALDFGATGIGLCRTEHMFFQRGRITPMREMILAETEEERRRALETLLPMQRSDFVGLFESMRGCPVTIRLLDPPLHEFLPHGDAELREMALSMEIAVAKVAARAAELAEFNPMLGKRGCRIGIAYPEIYEMQARAIFEAALDAAERTGAPVHPEIMIPLISAVRELDLLTERIDAIAADVRRERDGMVDYTIGVMIETPRACLRAGDIADGAGFMSFGTNDLTQMLYGLSRDDAGRFMPDYVAKGVFEHDPFHSLDVDGVGEIVRMAISRARARAPGITLGLCGEHGGDPTSVGFCEAAGLDYVSCSPYRVPVARLAAAQAVLEQERST